MSIFKMRALRLREVLPRVFHEWQSGEFFFLYLKEPQHTLTGIENDAILHNGRANS
jgi:hypothetical protein